MADHYGHVRRPDEPHCYNCGIAGHWAIACPEPTRQTPAGLEAWRSSSTTPGYGGGGGGGGGAGGRDHRNSQKKSKGPIITKYAPPPSSVTSGPSPPPPPPGSYPPPPPPPPGYHPPPVSGPYHGHPPASYPPHQHHPPPQHYPAYPPPPAQDPRFGYQGYPPHPNAHPPPSLPPPSLPPPPHYGPQHSYGPPSSAPPGYGGHGAPPPLPPGMLPPPSSHQPPPPPQHARPGYSPSYGAYGSPGNRQNKHSHGHSNRNQASPPPPQPTNYSNSFTTHQPSHASPVRTGRNPPPKPPPSASKTGLPPPPMTHSLPPKPPPSVFDRNERRRDNRNQRFNDNPDRPKGAREQHQQRDRDAGSNKQHSKKKKKWNQQGSQGQTKASEQETHAPTLERFTKETSQPDTENTKTAQDDDNEGEIAHVKPDLSPAGATSPSRSLQESRAQDDDTDKNLADNLDEDPFPATAVKNEAGPYSKADTKPVASPIRGRKDLDAVAIDGQPDIGDKRPKDPTERQHSDPDKPWVPKEDTSRSPITQGNGGESRTDKPRQSSSPLKRRRTHDEFFPDRSPEYSRPARVSESNLRSLESSHRRQNSGSTHNDSTRRDSRGYMRSRRRSVSRDGSRRSRRSSVSSRSSGLDSLEAELLGRPSKARSDDTVEHHDRHEKTTPKPKRRRPNVDSAYSRRW